MSASIHPIKLCFVPNWDVSNLSSHQQLFKDFQWRTSKPQFLNKVFFCLKQMYRQSGLTSNAVLWWKINMFVHAFKKYFTYLFIYMANFFPLDVLFCLVLIWKNRINIQWTHSSVQEQTKLKSFYLTSWSALYVLIFTCWLPSWH